MSCRFPGARNVTEFWSLLAGGRSAIGEIPPERWAIEGFYSPKFDLPNRSVSKWGGFLEGVDEFDHRFFNVSPREARSMDPQQRLLLEEVWHCVEDSGLSLSELRSARTGVFVGAMTVDYRQEMAASNDPTDGYAGSGNISCMLANRLSYVLGFSGPSLSINTACSASLAALHQARLSLQAGHCDFAVVAGVSLNLSSWKYLSFSKARMLSPDGRCKTFDQDANGYVPGEGVASILLQRLDDAIVAGCQIRGIVKGSALNHGGTALSLTAPRVEAQRHVVLEAWKSAGISLETCGYIEAHGTGTSLGDPIEIEALTQAFRAYTSKTEYCRIGSLKTNIGHLEPAAGIAGVIKTLLMFSREEIVPTLNIRTPNPLIDFRRSPFQLALAREPWTSPAGWPRRAGVSSFGFGGVNGHVVLEEYVETRGARPETSEPEIFILSAKTPDGLEALRNAWRQFCDGEDRPELKDACRTLQTGRESFSHRLGAIVRDWDQVSRVLNETPPVSRRDFYAVVIRGRANVHGMHQRACELIHLTRTPDVISGEGDGLYAALALSGILSLDQADRIRHFEIDGTVFRRPTIPFWDPVSGEILRPFQITPEYLRALAEGASALAPGALKEHARLLIRSQFTFKKNLENWNVPLADAGLSVDQLFESKDGSSNSLLAILIGDGLRKLNRKWKLATTLAFAEAQENELLDLLDDGVLQGLDLVQLLCGPRSGVNQISARADGSKVDECKQYPILRRHNEKLSEISDVAGWLREAAQCTANCGDAIVVGDEPISSELLIKLWLGGIEVRWDRRCAPGTFKRVALPLYPFQGEKFWVRPRADREVEEEGIRTDRDAASPDPPAGDALPPAVRDHWIDGKRILPAAAMIEAMLSAGGDHTSLSNILIREVMPVGEVIELKPSQRGTLIEINSGASVLAEAQFVAGSLCPKNDDLSAFRRGKEIPGAELYDWFANGGYEYGPVLRTIRRCWLMDGTAMFECCATERTRAKCDPALLDGVLQAGILAGHLFEMIDGGLFLPCRIGSFSMAGALHECCFVVAQIADFGMEKRELRAELNVFGGEGSRLAHLRNVLYRAAIRRNRLPEREYATASKGLDGDEGNGIQAPPVPESKLRGKGEARTLVMLKRELADMLSEILGVRQEKLDGDTDLREYGLDSIALSEYSDKVEEELEVDLDPTLLFQHPTLRGLAEYLAQAFSTQIEKRYGLTSVEEPPAPESELPIASEIGANPTPLQPDGAHDEIAVVGMAGRFPGGEDLESWWQQLAAGMDLISEIPSDRWDWREYFGDPSSEPNKTNCKWGGFIKDIDKFDAEFFRISPKEAVLMDPQQRILLEMAWHTMEDAGERPSRLAGSKTGVFVGVCNDDYRELIDRHAGSVEAQTSTGTYFSIIPNRISYWFDFHGPSVAVDTACSSSLVAIHQAIQAIRNDDCDLAMAGGVNLCCTPRRYISFSQAGMLSPDGRCRTFDSRANGYVRGEGAGFLLLKPLRRALADGNPIYGVIRGSAVNHGGKANSLTAPNPNAQADLLVAAYRRAGISPKTLGFIEAHGTGTALGDPIEIAGLKKAFTDSGFTDSKPTCGIGSVKTNVGHLESAAGVAGVIKVLLSLKHQTLPASLHFEQLNSHIDLANSPLFVVESTQAWTPLIDDQGRPWPRRAGVSSFGFGGANAHLVIEEANEPAVGPVQSEENEVILLSAKTVDRLEASVRQLQYWLRSREDGKVALSDLAHTLQVGREHFPARLALVVSSLGQLLDALEQFNQGDRRGCFFAAEANHSLLEDDPEDREFVRRLFEAGRLVRLAEFWAGGNEIPWEHLYRGSKRKRISLPGYPFARERYWIADMATIPPYPNPSGLNRAEEIAATDVRVRDHVVQGERILPGVAYLDLALSAATDVTGRQATKITHVHWLRPFVVNHGNARLVIELNKKDLGFDYEAVVGDGGNHTVSAGGVIDFSEIVPGRVIDLDAVRRRCPQTESGEAVYDVFRSGGVDYGPFYRGLREVRFSGTEFLGRIEFDTLPTGAVLPPPVMDSAVQITLWWFLKKQAGSSRLYLPFSADEVRIHGTPPRACFAYVRALEINDEAGFGRFQVTLLDDAGGPWVEVSDFTIRRIGDGEAARAEDGLLYYPTWKMGEGPARVEIRSARRRIIFTHAHDFGLSARLAGANCPIVFLGRHYDRAGARRVSIDCRRQSDFERVLSEFREAEEVYFLGGMGDSRVEATAEFDAHQDRSVLGLFRLIKALQALGRINRLQKLKVITNDAVSVTLGDGDLNPFGAAVVACSETLARETPNLPVHIVDLTRREALDTGDPETDPGRTVAVRAGRLYRRILRRFEVDAIGSGALPIESGDTCLIVGGASGIGFETARWLARRKVNLVLTGRRPHSEGIETGLNELRACGAKAMYCQADVADEDGMRTVLEEAHRSVGEIHGAIHSALVLKDGWFSSLDEASFQAALRPKVRGIHVLASLLKGESLKSFIVFSSANSFLANGGQSNYVAGCAFEDAFALNLERHSSARVRVINWGFWGETGVVANGKYAEELARREIFPMSVEEGMRALQTVWSGSIPQVMAARLGPSALDDIGFDPGVICRRLSRRGPSMARELADQVRASLPSEGGSLRELLGQIGAYGTSRLLRFFQSQGVFNEKQPKIRKADLVRRLALQEKFEPVLEALLDVLERCGAIRRNGNEILRVKDLPSGSTPLGEDTSAYVRLMDACLENLAPILGGRMDPLEVLFPNGAPDLVAGIYSGSLISNYYNELIARSVSTVATMLRSARNPDEPIRIVEVGGGVGGSTLPVLNALERAAGNVSYLFTDVSPALVDAAERRFGRRFPGIRFQTLDIEHEVERPLVGAFDVVIATNVLHATRNISESLRHIKALLAENGIFLLNEVTAQQPYLAMTFGLLDGWWRFRDAPLRLPHCPLLSADGWKRALVPAGLKVVAVFGDPGRPEGEDSAQALFLLESDGLVETPALPEPPRPAIQPPAPIEPIPSDESDEDLEGTVGRILGRAIGREVEKIHRDARFVDLGVDSIVGIQIINDLNRELGLALKTTALFNFTSLAELTEHIRHGHQPKPATRDASSTPATPKIESASVPASARPPKQDGANLDGGVAIVGMSGRFPGAPNLDAFWQRLADGIDCIQDVPTERWGRHENFYHPDRQAPNKSYLKAGGFLDGIEDFDPFFFDISPREAELMDPQQRLFLEESWRAFEDAGYSNREVAHRKCGVFVGVSKGDYFEKMHGTGLPLSSHTWIGTETSILAGRISYHLNLKGPAFPIDTACSSSLVALHLACQSLLAGECELALVGGVFVLTTPSFYVHTSKTLMLSPEAKCKAFDNSADGFVPGEGVAAVVLKSLEHALADGDHIYGVIRGSGINQDGKTNGITAPNARSQRALIEEVYRKSGVHPESVTYVEAHGTGTKLGDPIEVEALTDAFRGWTNRDQFCAIGSVKTNIGHTATVAGLAGLIKILLSLQHRQLPPSLHFSEPNENIPFHSTPFFVNTRLREWAVPRGMPRRAGLSSFGFSGTNAHVVVEEAPPCQRKGHSSSGPFLFCLSAKSPEALEARARDLIDWLEGAGNRVDPADLSYTLNAGRSHFGCRMAWVADNLTDLRAKLEARPKGLSIPSGDVKETASARAELARLGDLAALRDVRPVAELFVRGVEIDWQAFYRGQNVRRVSAPTYPFQRMRCWPWPADAAPMEVGGRKNVFLTKRWEPAPIAVARPVPPGNYLVIDTAGESAGGVLPEIPGVQWVVVGNGPEARRTSEFEWTFPVDQKDAGTRVWSELSRAIPIEGIVHLAWDAASSDFAPGLWAIYQRALQEYSRRSLRILVLTRGLQPFRNANPSLAGALFTGLARVLGAEFQSVLTKAVDLDRDDREDVRRLIESELGDCESQVEICYREQERHRATLAELPEHGAKEIAIDPARAYVITGGTGGLGFEAARFLVQRGARKLVVISRNPLDATGSPQKVQRIERLRNLGATVMSGNPSLCGERDLSEFFSEVRQKLGLVGGVIHCAGTVGSPGTPFFRKSMEEMLEVMSPKVAGTQTLARILASDPVEFFVLYSSVAGVIPNLGAGAADYACANAFLDFFAAAQHAAGNTRFLSIQWPSWKETGIGEVKSDKYRESGLLSLSTEKGVDFLDQALKLRGVANVLPALVDAERFSLPRLLEPAVKSPTSNSKQPRQSVNASGIDLSGASWLANLFARELKIPKDRIDVDANFAELGIDSVLLADLVKKIEAVIERPLDPSVLLEHPTIHRLATHLGAGGLSSPKTAVLAVTAEKDARQDRIAIVGVGCRFPGAEGKEAFWELLRAGRCAIREVPPERWDVARYYSRSGEKGKSIGKWGGFIENFDGFDASFFGITDRDAQQMDPLARLALEVGVQTVRDAGYEFSEVAGSRAGVYVGSRISTFADSLSELTKSSIVGIGQNFIAAQIAQFLDLKGPNLVVDTACSSSLVAVHLACQSLLAGECEMALAGGVDLLLDERIYLLLTEAKALSPDGRCYTFDQRANGYVPGEGCGFVMLKPLSKVRADRDRVYGVIDGSAVNNDGRTMGITTPNPAAQRELIEEVLKRTGIHPTEISLIEAHGTGTMIGDPIELKALTEAFRRRTDARQYCAVGSVKTNLGHLHSAAGIASLIKVVLAMQARELPPTLQCKTPNPRFTFERSPFYPCTEIQDWKTSESHARRAGVSSFGFGGTNCHLIVSEAEPADSPGERRPALAPIKFHRKRYPVVKRGPVRVADFENDPQLRIEKAREVPAMLAIEEIVEV